MGSTEGSLREIAGNRPLPLIGALVWTVETGNGDLFIAPTDPSAGPRRFLAMLTPGTVLFGTPEGGPFVLLAVVGSAATLREQSGAEFWATSTPEALDAAAEWWTGALATAGVAPPAGTTAEALAAFTTAMLEAEQAQRDVQRSAAAKRLQERQDADGAMVSSRLADLARAAQASKSPPPPETAQLVEVMRLIGTAMKVTVVTPMDEIESTIESVEAIARASHLRSRWVALGGDWWRREGGPLLAFRDGRPVAVLPGRRGYQLAEPGLSPSRLTGALASMLSPDAVMFYQPLPDRPTGTRDLLRLSLARGGADLWRIGLSAMAAGLLGATVPLLAGLVVGVIIPQAARASLLVLGLAVALIAVAAALFGLAQGIATVRLEFWANGSLQPAVWDRLLRLPVGFFRHYTAGELASRAMASDTIRQLVAGVALSTIVSGVFAIFSLLAIFVMSVPLGLVATVLGLVPVLLFLALARRQARAQRELVSRSNAVAGLVFQLVSAIVKVRVAGAEARAFATWAHDYARQKEAQATTLRLSNTLNVLIAVWPLLALVGLFWSAAAISGPDLNTGAFVAINAAFGQWLAAILATVAAIDRVLPAAQIFENAWPIFRAVPEVTPDKTAPGPISGAIELSRVSFRYTSDGPLTLDGVSLRAAPGEFVAIAGPSGAGKSTILRILLGFEQPEQGMVSFDGKDLAHLDVEAVRRQFGVVIQNARVLRGTIFQNIAGAASHTKAEAWAAADLAGIADDIRRLPMGLDTVVDENGTPLSGGQVQRLMIARAVINRPKVLLFDEATSALDNHSQAEVMKNIEQLASTRIVIAHRLSTIRDADRIYVIDRGQVVQEGTFASLLAEPGLFADLAARQIP